MRFTLLPAILAGLATVVGCQKPVDGSASQPFSARTVGAHEPVYVRIPQARLTRSFLQATGFNRDHKRDDTYAFGYLPRQALDLLADEVRGEITELDARQYGRFDFDAKSLSLKPSFLPEGALDWTRRDHRLAAEGYHDYTALTAELQKLANDHPGIVTLTSAGKSVQNRELWYLKISDDAATDEAEPKLLYIGNMHGDEVVGREMMIYLARELLSGYGTDERITNLVNHSQIFIMPSMNPDGFELHQRYNADGVDLNRDFPDFTSDPRDTPNGRAVETQAIMALHAQHHFLSTINFHGGEVCFNIPWDTQANGARDEKFGDDAFTNKVARDYAEMNETMRDNSGGSFDRGVTYGYEWYEVDGGLQDWANYYRSSIHSTVELSFSKWPNASELASHWAENKESLIGYLESSLVGMHLAVVNGRGEPVTASTVRIGTADRDVRYTTPFLSRPAIGSAQTVTVTAPGFAPATLNLAPRAFDGTFTDVPLTALAE